MLVSHHGRRGALKAIVGFFCAVSGDRSVAVIEKAAESEAAWGHHNIALANFMKGFGTLNDRPEDVLEVYFRQYAIKLNCLGLPQAMTFMAASGRDPASGRQIVSPRRERRINVLILTCGQYDASDDFAFRGGLPGKSGVGGGIAAVAPDALSAAVWSPEMNGQGNSAVGTLAQEELSCITGHSIL